MNLEMEFVDDEDVVIGDVGTPPALKHSHLSAIYRHPTTEGLKGACQRISSSHWLEVLIISAILSNTIILAVQNPANQFSEKTTLFLMVADLVLSCVFTIEMFIRIIAMEFVGKYAYLDDAWNRLDFVVVLSSWVNILVELFDFDLGIEVSTLRALRILRTLRSLRFFEGIKTILSTIYSALPLATNVVVFIGFLFVVCGIIGVQMFKGATRNRCAPGGYMYMASQEDFRPPQQSTSRLAPELHMLSLSYENATGNLSGTDWLRPVEPVVCAGQELGLQGEYPIGIGMWHTYCTVHSDCPMFNETQYEATGCAPQLCFPVENPGRGVHSYDNILYGWVTLFINMSCLYWWETAHRYYDLHNGLGSIIAWGFGFFNVFVLTYVSVNMFVAVITTVFADVRSAENPAGAMGSSETPTAEKWENRRKIYAAQHAAWQRPGYFMEALGGRGPHLEKQHPLLGQYPMVTAYKEKVLVECVTNHNTTRDVRPGIIVDINDEDRMYEIEFQDVEERETAWLKRKRIKVPAELEKQGMMYHPLFDKVVMLFIFWNTGTLAAEHHDPDACIGTGQPTIMCQSDGFQGTMGLMEYIFNFVFSAEAIIKILGSGFMMYIGNWTNRLDFFIVITSVLDMLGEMSGATASSGGSSILRLFRVFRLFRVLRVARVLYRNENLKRLLETVFGSGEALGNLTLFIVFATLLFGIMGMHLFGGNYTHIDGTDTYWGRLNGPAQYYKHTDFTRGNWSVFAHAHDHRHTYGYDVEELINKTLIPRRNFEDMPRAFLLAFQIMTGDDWVNQMHDHMAIYNIWAPPLLFFSAFVFCNYTLLSLFIAVILENFEIAEAEKLALQKEAAVKKKVDEERAKALPIVTFVHRLTWLFGGTGKREGSLWSYTRPANTDDEGCFLPGGLWYNNDVALFVFGPDAPFRKACLAIVHNSWFDHSILVCILVSSIMLAAEGPANSLDPEVLDIFEIIGHILFGIFMVEFLFKLCALGFMFTPKAYMKDPWNRLDFLVIIASVMSYTPFETGNLGRVFRLGRCLRPLRMINRNEGMKIIITAVIDSLAVNLGVLSLAFMLLLIFGILGVALFAGQFQFCTCSHVFLDRNGWGFPLEQIAAAKGAPGGLQPIQVVTRGQCVGEHRANNETIYGIDPAWPDAIAKCVWELPPYHFDNTWEAIMALFTCSTLAGWTDIMERGLDMVGVDRQPVYFNSWYFAIYFISFVFVMAFFITNLFIGVLIDFIRHSNGSALVTEEQQKWIDTQRFQKQHSNIERVMHPDEFNPVRRAFYSVVESVPFDNLSNFVIIFNVVIMMLEHHDMDPEFWQLLEHMNFGCLVFFTVEMTCKVIGYLPVGYWHDPWNKFDATVVTVSWAAIVLELGNVQAVRAFRTFRIVLVLKRAKGIRSLFGTLMMSIPPALNISVLMSLLYCLYAILGMQLFGDATLQDVLYWTKQRCWKEECFTIMVDRSQYATECVQPLNQDVFYPCTPTTGPMLHGGNRQYTSHSSFRSFFSAMALLFQCATGQDWKFVMYALEGPDGAKTGIFIYFSSFFFLSNYILANLFIAVILDNFSACLREEELEITEGDILIFRDEYRQRSDEKHPEILYWASLEPLLLQLGTHRGTDDDGREIEFPLVPPELTPWNEEQTAVWEKHVTGRKKIRASELRGLTEELYNHQTLVDQLGTVHNPLYGVNQPGGFGPGGRAAEGGAFGRWWLAFIELRTTSVERVGDGDGDIEAVLDALVMAAEGGEKKGGTLVFRYDPSAPVSSVQAYVQSLRFREKYGQIVDELEFHAVVYTGPESFIRYTQLMQALVNARLGTDALSLDEQIKRGLVSLELEESEDRGGGTPVANANPMLLNPMLSASMDANPMLNPMNEMELAPSDEDEDEAED